MSSVVVLLVLLPVVRLFVCSFVPCWYVCFLLAWRRQFCLTLYFYPSFSLLPSKRKRVFRRSTTHSRTSKGCTPSSTKTRRDASHRYYVRCSMLPRSRFATRVQLCYFTATECDLCTGSSHVSSYEHSISKFCSCVCLGGCCWFLVVSVVFPIM